MTKIDIFSGFLGAGKTTLIKKLLNEAYKGEKVVLIENEFGEIGIDGGFLKNAGVEITEMNSGCICCSLVGDFKEALKKVLDDFLPERVLIEPSGVGKLSDVIKAVEKIDSDSIVLNSFTAVVDAKKCKTYMKNFGEFYNDQIECAGCIVLSHTYNMPSEKVQACIELVRDKNSKASIVSTPWEDLDGKRILEAMESSNYLITDMENIKSSENCPKCGGHHHDHEGHCEHEHHHHHADDVFTSWGTETAVKFSTEQIKDALQYLDNGDYGQILRAKGIVAEKTGKWIYFDYVPGEADVRFGEADVVGRICVIGANVNTKAIERLFDANDNN